MEGLGSESWQSDSWPLDSETLSHAHGHSQPQLPTSEVRGFLTCPWPMRVDGWTFPGAMHPRRGITGKLTRKEPFKLLSCVPAAIHYSIFRSRKWNITTSNVWESLEQNKFPLKQKRLSILKVISLWWEEMILNLEYQALAKVFPLHLLFPGRGLALNS